ncbi:hypothetical protein IQ238_18140 [Pleurocapsales cyanobacterium LEGE 06147]|nr:hypothetical protein [Pleurocapsales cyanobacterium LEGE 06147]
MNASCYKSAEPTAVALCRETRPPRCLPNALAPNDKGRLHPPSEEFS